MDKVKKYQKIIMKLLEEQAAERFTNIPLVENQIIADTLRHRYLLMRIGWADTRFIASCVLHFEIKNRKIWVQQNWTEAEVARELEDEGVPKSDIVLAFQPEALRPYTGYATN
jgi:hypothetical protein